MTTPWAAGGWNSYEAAANKSHQEVPVVDPTITQLIALFSNSHPQEFQAEVDRAAIRANGAALTADDYEDVAMRMGFRHLTDFDQVNRVQRAEAVDLSQLHPAFRQTLENTGASAGDCADAATRIYPNLSRQQAVAKWMDAARKVDYSDLKYGTPTSNPLEGFSRAVGPQPQESTD